MIRGIVTVVVVIFLAVGGWLLWRQVNGVSAFGSGDVKPREVAADKDRTDAAFTDLDGNQNKQTTARDNDTLPPEGIGAATNQLAADKKEVLSTHSVAQGTGSDMQVAGSTPVPQDQSTSAAQPTVVDGSPAAALPVSDTISPNPPNGAVFTGTGRYQWYRQGNITWRVNSGNGSSCIAFATMDEWQKQIVYSHGCGNA